MNQPRKWTLVGVWFVALAAALQVLTSVFSRIIRTEVAAHSCGVRNLLGELRRDLRTSSGEIKADIASLDNTIDLLDRDVQAIARRVFPR